MEETVGHGLGGLGVQIVWMGGWLWCAVWCVVVGLARTVLWEGSVGSDGVLDRLVLMENAVDGDALCLTLVRGGRVWVFPAWRTVATLAMSWGLGV